MQQFQNLVLSLVLSFLVHLFLCCNTKIKSAQCIPPPSKKRKITLQTISKSYIMIVLGLIKHLSINDTNEWGLFSMKKFTSIIFKFILFVCVLGVAFGIYCIATTPFSLPYFFVAFTWILIWCAVAKYILKKKKTLAAGSQTNGR